MKPKHRTLFVWLVLLTLVLVPLVLASASPLLAWRQPIYIGAGLAGVLALSLLLFQPLLVSHIPPGISKAKASRYHRALGIALTVLVLLHVAGLWITSPPDVIDALMFRSPTPFAPWGVIAMWALLISASIAILRKRLPWSAKRWRLVHRSLAFIIVLGTVVHAILIDGTMESMSKIMLCVAVCGAMLGTVRSR